MMYPYSFRHPYYYPGVNYRRQSNSFSQPDAFNDCKKSSYESDLSNSNCEKEEQRSAVTENRPAFTFLGITLYFDDLLLLALIYFLYKEDVQDPELFIALILLLLS